MSTESFTRSTWPYETVQGHTTNWDHLQSLATPRKVDETPLRQARQMLAKGMARRAMEALSGAERVAMATMPEPEPLSEQDIDELARIDEARQEGRFIRRLRRPNPHDD